MRVCLCFVMRCFVLLWSAVCLLDHLDAQLATDNEPHDQLTSDLQALYAQLLPVGNEARTATTNSTPVAALRPQLCIDAGVNAFLTFN